jgi:hypothetical protein
MALVIRAISSINGPPVTFKATVRGLAIYLDNWAVGDLAEGHPSRRKRFIAALWSGSADLMFSVANAAELAGPQGKSFDLVKSFLNEVGPNWFPIELDVSAVVQREKCGADPAASCISEDFMRAYFANRTASYSPGSGKVIDLSETFSGLGAVLDWVGGPSQRDSIRKQSAELDDVIKEAIRKDQAKYERNPLPTLPFDASRPATSTSFNLVKTLIAESNQWKKGDGLDFFHAVMASSYATVAALDRPWKRRIEKLPKPNKLARIYSGPELDKMVTDIESCVRQGGALL